MKFKAKFQKLLHKNIEHIKKNEHLKFLQPLITSRHLLRMSPHSIASGVAIGLGCAWIPMPMHTMIAILLCVPFQGNIAVAATAIWIANPFTMPEMYFFAYELGSKILNVHVQLKAIHVDAHDFFELLNEIWQPLILGCLICGLITGIISLFVIKIIYNPVKR